WRAGDCGWADAQCAARLDCIFQFAERRGGEARGGGHADAARRPGEGRQLGARRQFAGSLRGDRRRARDRGQLSGCSAGPVPRRPRGGGRGGAGRRRRVRGRHGAGQARRDLHAEGGCRRLEEERALAGRLRQEGGGAGCGREQVIAELGHYALMLALGLALIQGTMPLVGARSNDAVLMSMATPAALAQFVFVALSFAALAVCYVTSDFSVLNVYENSNSAMPLIYRLTSIWGNHEGSMMLWVFILTFFGALVAVFGNNLPVKLKANSLAVQAWIAAAFDLFILVTSNPFLRIANAPLEGRDLNPILQDPGLAFHPPMLYLGYVGFSIAFSFAIAALLEGRIDAAWARWVRPWVLGAWMCLTLGIAGGSYWAYYELGWGGYWFWDPVENASLMPWL